MLTLLRTGLSITLIITLFGHLCECRAADSGNITQDAFKDCSFQFINTPHITRTATTNNGLRLHGDGICSFHLSKAGFLSMGDTNVSLIIVRDYGSLINQAADQSGFERKTDGDWKFIGLPFSLGKLLKYRKLSFEKINNGKDTTLVGRQMEYGTDQTGTPMTFEGVHVLRTSPTYAISINMPFDPSVSAITRNEVVKDMIQVVNSVRPAPEIPTTSTLTTHQ